jgi:hypothetical protein
MHESPCHVSGRIAALGGAVLRIVCVFAIALGFAVGVVFLAQPYLRTHSSARVQASPGLAGATPFFSPGIDRPPAVPAGQVELDEGEEVIGVTVAGKARAYWVSAFAGREQHIVNDLLSGCPITVTHCDRNGCTRVFTSSKEHAPLDVACAGAYAGGLLISAPGGIYAQDEVNQIRPGIPAFPYASFAFVKTSWGEWLHDHPDSDVYLG